MAYPPASARDHYEPPQASEAPPPVQSVLIATQDLRALEERLAHLAGRLVGPVPVKGSGEASSANRPANMGLLGQLAAAGRENIDRINRMHDALSEIERALPGDHS